jgi:transposase
VDKTSIEVQGRNHWIWVTRKFKGTIICDGWKSYSGFTKHLQRCWAHLLRESKDLAEKIPEAVPSHGALRNIYEQLNDALKNDPLPEVRRVLWYLARAMLNQLANGEYASEKVRKLIGKISNGSEYGFTFVVQPGVEPTNSKGTAIHERLMTVLAT